MIQVIAGYKLKEGANISHIFLKLRSVAMTYAGFVSAQNLQNVQDSSIVAMLSTWDNLESWRLWETSKARQEILKEAEPFLVEKPKVTIYAIAPTIRWVG